MAVPFVSLRREIEIDFVMYLFPARCRSRRPPAGPPTRNQTQKTPLARQTVPARRAIPIHLARDTITCVCGTNSTAARSSALAVQTVLRWRGFPFDSATCLVVDNLFQPLGCAVDYATQVPPPLMPKRAC